MNDNGQRASFLQRPVAIVTLVAGVIGTATGAVTLYGLFHSHHKSDRDVSINATGPTAPPTTEDASARRIDACVRNHGLTQTIQKEQVETDRVLVRQCAWPPAVGAAPDGYAEIALAIGTGPGKSEAEGLTVSNTFTTECQNLELTYLFSFMGTFVPNRPFRISKGEIRRVEDGSIWKPRTDTEASIYTPRRDQSLVMSNTRYRFDTARCV